MEKKLPLKVGVTHEFKRLSTEREYFRLILKYRGFEVGHCSLIKSKLVANTYTVNGLEVPKQFQRGHKFNHKPEEYFGFGNELISAVNEFLIKKKALGRLVDGIHKPEAKGMYEKMGWKAKVDDNFLYFDGRQKK